MSAHNCVVDTWDVSPLLCLACAHTHAQKTVATPDRIMQLYECTSTRMRGHPAMWGLAAFDMAKSDLNSWSRANKEPLKSLVTG